METKEYETDMTDQDEEKYLECVDYIQKMNKRLEERQEKH